MQLPDVQSNVPTVQITLSRVGVTKVKKLVEIARAEKRPIVLMCNFDIFVNLPADRKGANLSRNFEAVNEVINEAIARPVYKVEDLCSEIAKRLLERHEYATSAEVKMISEYMIQTSAPISKISSQEMVDIHAEAHALRKDQIEIIKTIGVEVVGMTVCPCAHGIFRDKTIKLLQSFDLSEDQIKQYFENIPVAGHNQRGRGFISMQVFGEGEVSINELIMILRNSMSSETYEIMKRSDEQFVVNKAHMNPEFVEDCVRNMARQVVDSFIHLSGDTMVTIRQVNEESIHRHNAFAERYAPLGELRKEMDPNHGKNP